MGKADIDRSITIDPNNAWAYRNKGWYYYLVGKHEDAVRLLERALVLDPYVDKGHLFLSQVYFDSGDVKRGCQSLKKAKEQNKNIPQQLTERCI